jgi:hypothetical protein
MDEEPRIPVSLPTPPNVGLRLRPPPVPPSLQVRLPPAPLPVGQGTLATISPQRRNRTKYPLGHITLQRSKGPGVSRMVGTTSAGAGRGDSEEETPMEDEGLSYSEYLECIQSGVIGFYKLHGDIYVVQGWDGKRKVAKVRVTSNLSLDVLNRMTQNKWYHLHCSSMGKESAIVCFCPAKNTILQECVHSKFLTEFGEEQFEDYDTDNGSKWFTPPRAGMTVLTYSS